MSESTPLQTAIDLLDNRIDRIEKILDDIQNLVISNKLQEAELTRIKEKLTECVNAVNAHDKRIKNLEVEPLKNSANRWNQIVDAVFKMLVMGLLGLLAVRLGFK